MKQTYLDSMPLSEKPDDNILGSSRSTEVRKLGNNFVLKELGKPYFLQRRCTETDEEYTSRRIDFCIEVLKNEKDLADEAKGYIPNKIKTYPESYFIFNGKDGFPVPFKVQEVVNGKTLREQPDLVLTASLKKDLNDLVTASIKCFIKTGKVLDLVGCVGGDGDGAWEEVKRHLNPIKYAANLMTTTDNRIAFIDARVGGGNMAKQIVSLMTLTGYYWKLVSEKIVKKKAHQPITNI